MLLSNVYLYYVLDLWFEKVVKPRLKGEAYLIRYIDDFVVCFQYRADAFRFQDVLQARLARFSLEVEPDKTRLVEFGRFALRHAKERGKKLETIYFLGFTHYCTLNRRGNFMVGRKTERSRFRRSVSELTQIMRAIRHHSVADQAAQISQFLRGHYTYYGIGGNLRSLLRLYRITERYWHKMLCSRSQKSYIPWEKFQQMKLTTPIQQPRLYMPF